MDGPVRPQRAKARRPTASSTRCLSLRGKEREGLFPTPSRLPDQTSHPPRELLYMWSGEPPRCELLPVPTTLFQRRSTPDARMAGRTQGHERGSPAVEVVQTTLRGGDSSSLSALNKYYVPFPRSGPHTEEVGVSKGSLGDL